MRMRSPVSRSGPDVYDGCRRAGRGWLYMRWDALELLADVDRAHWLLERRELTRRIADLGDAPARDRRERRGAQGLARAQAEACVMPGASHRVPDDEPRLERRTVVCAYGADREQLTTAPRQENRLTERRSKQHGSVRNPRELDALREIRPFESRLPVTHDTSARQPARTLRVA
jgi:hypothetical protein